MFRIICWRRLKFHKLGWLRNISLSKSMVLNHCKEVHKWCVCLRPINHGGLWITLAAACNRIESLLMHIKLSVVTLSKLDFRFERYFVFYGMYLVAWQPQLYETILRQSIVRMYRGLFGLFRNRVRCSTSVVTCSVTICFFFLPTICSILFRAIWYDSVKSLPNSDQGCSSISGAIAEIVMATNAEKYVLSFLLK